MKPTVLITHRIPPEGLEPLFDQAEVLYPREALSFTPAEMMAFAPRVWAVLAAGPLDAAFIEAAPNLLVISNYGAGYEQIDVAAATRAGIPVVTLPETVDKPTAELALTLLLAASRRVGELNTALRSGDPAALFGLGKHMGHALWGKTLGIIGLGRIGSRMARLGQALDMRVVYHNRRPKPEAAAQGMTYLPLEELLRQSDALSLHCPLTPETRGLLSAERLSLLPQGAILINTARGAIVDYEALAELLEQGRLGGAGLDVFPEEPRIPDRLIRLPGVVLTPHIGSNTVEDRREMARAAATKLLQALAGERPQGIINPEVFHER